MGKQSVNLSFSDNKSGGFCGKIAASYVKTALLYRKITKYRILFHT